VYGVPEVAVIGAGAVGVACAGSILQSGVAERLVLYDRNADRARGEALDFEHGSSLLPASRIEGRPLTEAAPADLAILAAGARNPPGASRMEVLDQNLEVASDVADAFEDALPRVMMVVANPVDPITEYLTRRFRGRGVGVFGSGTALDSWRLRECLAGELAIHPSNVHAWAIGEHGLSMVLPFSCVRVGPFTLEGMAEQRGTPLDLDAVDDYVRRAGPRVHLLKGSTTSAIGLAAARLATHVLREHGYLIPVSVPVEEGVCASLPARLGPAGAGEPLMPKLNAAEQAAWEASLDGLREAATRIPVA
jgi:L-lactate dehydrogenase